MSEAAIKCLCPAVSTVELNKRGSLQFTTIGSCNTSCRYSELRSVHYSGGSVCIIYIIGASAGA